jgi:circadian clock protein KaiB
MRAVERVTRLCERHLAGRYQLSVIDIYENPALAEVGQVVAAPTLVKQLPAPLRRIVGDMADEERILMALNVRGAA